MFHRKSFLYQWLIASSLAMEAWLAFRAAYAIYLFFFNLNSTTVTLFHLTFDASASGAALFVFIATFTPGVVVASHPGNILNVYIGLGSKSITEKIIINGVEEEVTRIEPHFKFRWLILAMLIADCASVFYLVYNKPVFTLNPFNLSQAAIATTLMLIVLVPVGLGLTIKDIYNGIEDEEAQEHDWLVNRFNRRMSRESMKWLWKRARRNPDMLEAHLPPQLKQDYAYLFHMQPRRNVIGRIKEVFQPTDVLLPRVIEQEKAIEIQEKHQESIQVPERTQKHQEPIQVPERTQKPQESIQESVGDSATPIPLFPRSDLNRRSTTNQ